MARNTEIAKTWKDENDNVVAIKNSNVAYIPVTIEGASEDYLYFAKLGRLCKDEQEVYAVTVAGQSLKSSIDAVNAQLAAAESKEEIIAALDAMKALIDANEGTVLAKDFDTTSAVAKLTAFINAEIEAATTVEEVEVIDAEVDGYVSAYGIDATALKEVIAAAKEAFAAERLGKAVYAPVEMDMLNDYFATRAERGGTKDTFWYDGSKPYNAYLGYFQQGTKLPMTKTAYSNGSVISVDADGTGIDKLATLTNGRYVLPIGGVPYRLGSMTENVVDANAFEIGTQITISDTNELNDRLDDKYAIDASSTYYTVYSGNFPVDVKTNKINVVTTGMTNTQASGTYSLYAVDALVHLDDGSSVGYVLLTAPGFANGTGRTIEETVVFVPKDSETDYSSYSAIKNAIGGEVKTLNDMTDYDLADIKLPSAPGVKAVSVSSSNMKGLTGETVGETRQMYYDNVILPESAQEIYKDNGYKTCAYASSFEITAPEGRTITSVEFIHDADSTLRLGYAPAVGGYAATSGNDTSFFIPATVAGLEDYDAYVRITRNCRYSAVLGMTAETTGTELIANLNTLMANATESDIADIEAMKAFIDGETVLYTDIDAAARANYEKLLADVNVSGTITMTFEEGVAAKATVTINNIAELAGKPYKVILAYYDANENLLGTKIVDGYSTTDKTKTFDVTSDSLPDGTKMVKGFIWKDFTTLIPLAAADEAVASSYALDRFFDVNTGTFKADATGELNIAFIGDSLTEGTSATSGGVSGNDGLTETHWTYVISKYFEDNTDMTVNLYNAGIGGTTTEFSVPLVKSTVFSKNPDIVILENVNDLGTSAAKYEAAVENIIRRLLMLDKKPLIMYYHAATPYTPDDGTQWPVVVSTESHRSWETQETKRDNVNAICEKYGVPVLDYVSFFEDYTNYAKDEIMTTLYNKGNVHPKAAGYQLMGTFATDEFVINPTKYFVRHNDVEDVTAKYATAENSYTVTQPNSSRFTYNGFTNYRTYTDAASTALINERQFAYPFAGNVQQATTAGATVEFTTDTTELIVYSVNPTKIYRSNYADIYVDGVLVKTLSGANPYASNYNYAKITDGLDGELHKIKIVTREIGTYTDTNNNTTNLDIFNFMFIAEKE